MYNYRTTKLTLFAFLMM